MRDMRGEGMESGVRGLKTHLAVVSEIRLAADEDDGKTLAEVENFGYPLLLHVVKRV